MDPTPRTSAMITRMLKALETPSRNLTEWEEDFLASVQTRFDRQRTLTDPQFEKLEQIYAGKTK